MKKLETVTMEQAPLSKFTKTLGVGFLSWKGIGIDDHEAERNANKKIEGK